MSRGKDKRRNDPQDGSPGSSNSSSSSSSSMIPSPGLLPSYLASAFAELYEEDGLMVLAKGLGWMSLLASFVRFYADVEEGHASMIADELQRTSAPLVSPSPSSSSTKGKTDFAAPPVKPPLVLVLGLRQVEHEALLSILDSWGTPHHMMPKSITNESGQGKDRLGTSRRTTKIYVRMGLETPTSPQKPVPS